jgi:transcriptional regulator with XRE-family HTH domain
MLTRVFRCDILGVEDSKMSERLKIVRDSLDLSQAKFGDKLGIGRAAISKIEKGHANLTEGNIKLICRQFNISEEWLRHGTGEMTEMTGDDELYFLIGSELEELSPLMRNAFRKYLKLPKQKKQFFEEILQELFEGCVCQSKSLAKGPRKV